ncbi:MAG: hypothetical protein U0946_00015 [Patescibacteria group bacterium]|nr:hypothetical protein [Patescibacteria group bacterium]
MPVLIDGEIYGGGENGKVRLFVWSSAEKMKNGWLNKGEEK